MGKGAAVTTRGPQVQTESGQHPLFSPFKHDFGAHPVHTLENSFRNAHFMRPIASNPSREVAGSNPVTPMIFFRNARKWAFLIL